MYNVRREGQILNTDGSFRAIHEWPDKTPTCIASGVNAKAPPVSEASSCTNKLRWANTNSPR